MGVKSIAIISSDRPPTRLQLAAIVPGLCPNLIRPGSLQAPYTGDMSGPTRAFLPNFCAIRMVFGVVGLLVHNAEQSLGTNIHLCGLKV